VGIMATFSPFMVPLANMTKNGSLPVRKSNNAVVLTDSSVKGKTNFTSTPTPLWGEGWGGTIRAALVKYREVKQSHQKLTYVKSMVTLLDLGLLKMDYMENDFGYMYKMVMLLEI